VADQISRKSVLFNRLLEGKLSPTELEELIKWLGAEQADADAGDLILQHLKQADASGQTISPDIMARLEARLPRILSGEKRRGRIVSMAASYAAAALLLIAAGLYLMLHKEPANNKNQVVKAKPLTPEQIHPGKDGAILTLADGSKLVLDSLGNGLVSMQNGIKVSMVNGQLVYDAANTAALSSVATAYNTMSTPKGRQFNLVLPDGSKVWLNAASSIRYPILFTGNERKVEITGEAYFEVAKNARMPFKVKVNDETEIEVLGTHFNINSYENEASINTTLLEGSVKVKNSSGILILKPGEQAQSVNKEKIKLVKEVNIDKVMAWKNGYFDFQDATLQEVMRQLERWYDIEVVYEQEVPELEFYGKMGKDLSLAAVLSGLEKSNVHFRMESGRKLVVLP
jgi:ferric-dicitrate binding protein FerR (iron transport regulator)